MGFILDNIPGVILTIIVLLGIFIEITPIKYSPLAHIGKKLNTNISDKVDRMEKKLDEHIADDMRTYILNFQWECLNKERHTIEEWHRVHKMCGKYEQYIKENNMVNSEADVAIKYIQRTYEHCLDYGDPSFIFKIEEDK